MTSNGSSSTAALAGRDPGTILAALKLENSNQPQAERGDIAGLRVGHIILAAGRTREGGLRVSMALAGVVELSTTTEGSAQMKTQPNPA